MAWPERVEQLKEERDKAESQRNKLLALLATVLTFDWELLFAEAGGVPASQTCDWDEFLAHVTAAVEGREE